MTARDGNGEWHGGVESASGTVTVGEGVREWWTLVAVCVGTFMLLLDVTIVNVALPKIRPGWGRASQTCSGLLTPTHSRSQRCC